MTTKHNMNKKESQSKVDIVWISHVLSSNELTWELEGWDGVIDVRVQHSSQTHTAQVEWPEELQSNENENISCKLQCVRELRHFSSTSRQTKYEKFVQIPSQIVCVCKRIIQTYRCGTARLQIGTIPSCCCSLNMIFYLKMVGSMT